MKPASAFRRSSSDQRAFLRLLSYALRYWPILAGAILCAALYGGVRAGRMLLIKPLLDDWVMPLQAAKTDTGEILGSIFAPQSQPDPTAAAAAHAELDHLAADARRVAPQIALFVLVILTALPVTHFGQDYLSNYLLGRVLVDLQREVCAKLLALPLSFHTQTPRGETLSRVLNDTTRAHMALGQFLVEMVQAMVMLLVGLALLAVLSWQLTLTLALAVPVLSGAIGFFGQRIRKSARRRQVSQADVTHRLVQIMNGIKIVKAFRAEEGEARAFGVDNLTLFRRNLKVVKHQALSRASIEALTQLIGIGIVVVGGYALWAGWWGLTIGTLASFVLLMLQTYRPMRDLSRAWPRLQEAEPSAARFFEVLDAVEEIPDAADAVELPGVHHGIAFRHLTFDYGGSPVLVDVDFEVQVGQMVAVVGRTGSGKTTLMDLLLRLWDPTAGGIEVDGIDLRKLKRTSWLDHVAVVTQEPFLFSGTIRDNILYGRPNATEAEMLAAARAARVDEFADREGYDREVGDSGVMLSGGQRQRITIARAILKRPDVLIFDEATSALDTQSEKLVQEAIESLLQGRTTFVIAHRLSTVRHADKILVLDGGRVREMGTHDQLMARGGAYAELMKAQEFAGADGDAG